MNTKAAAFACHITGLIAIVTALFLWKVMGVGGFLLGLIGSGFWFGLGSFYRRQI